MYSLKQAQILLGKNPILQSKIVKEYNIKQLFLFLFYILQHLWTKMPYKNKAILCVVNEDIYVLSTKFGSM